ncbi:uncharacterized protein LOC115034203 [Acyrthosiphon pisum]|uniref:Uncharacterized protein n=1 Tax=Acyrthosiphon pisum TaxID=7029 RepID=A0A8R2NR79_ACYPI|nr:uncharacterized protein LOC115034203 [Acyrthosiphon pisum]
MLLIYVDQLIDMTTLSRMKSEQVYKLLNNFPYGIIFKFEEELVQWQNNINNLNIATNANEMSLKKSNVETIAKPHKSSHNLRVDEVLALSTQGSLILDYFKTHNKLNDGIRATLVDILIAQVLSQQIPMSVSLAESLANQIVAMFKTEVKDTYFMKIGCNKNPKGKLYSKYYNSVRNMKNTGLIPTTIIKNKIINDNQPNQILHHIKEENGKN